MGVKGTLWSSDRMTPPGAKSSLLQSLIRGSSSNPERVWAGGPLWTEVRAGRWAEGGSPGRQVGAASVEGPSLTCPLLQVRRCGLAAKCLLGF